MHWRTLAVISAGGVLGAIARYGLTSAFPSSPAGFDWAVFGINVAGCFCIGIVVVALTESRQAHYLIRPFLATGVLGGFTTFSTYVVGVQRAVIAGAPRTALLYAAATPAVALAAAWAGIRLAAAVTGPASRAEQGDLALDELAFDDQARDDQAPGGLSAKPATDLPATDLPATDLPATDLPATDLPATDLPAADLPDEGLLGADEVTA
jgi:fluoride exporter